MYSVLLRCIIKFSKLCKFFPYFFLLYVFIEVAVVIGVVVRALEREKKIFKSRILSQNMAGAVSKLCEFSEKCELFNFCLEVEDGKFWVPKETLAILSRYFKKLLMDGGYKEAKEGRAHLEGKKAKDILEFLRCIIKTYEFPAVKQICCKC